MMQQSANSMLGTLALLRKLSPPDAVVHIGAGGGIGALHQWREWSVPHALIVDADADKLQWAELPLADNPNWQCKSALLSDTEGDLTFYQATNPDEDGLIEPEGLRTLWPNLGTTTPSLRSATRLDHLIGAQFGIAQQPGHTTWGIVDCLPALPILRGAGGALNGWSVLCVRVLFEPCGEIHAGATLQTVEQFLKPMGFNLVHTESGNHPLVGHALFVKDWRTSHYKDKSALANENAELIKEKATLTAARAAETQAKEQAIAQRDALAKEKAEFAKQNAALTTDKTALANENAELIKEKATLIAAHAAETQAKEQAIAQRDALAKEKAEFAQQKAALTTDKTALANENAELIKEKTTLIAACDAETQAKEQALAQRDALAKEKAELAQQNAALTKDKSALTNENAELIKEKPTLIAARAAETQAKDQALAQRDALSNEKAELAKQNAELAKERGELVAAHDEQTKLAAERQKTLATQKQEVVNHQQRIQHLEAENQENTIRQQMQQDELLKAEAQIELIKDLLLREPGL